MQLTQIETPALILDLNLFEENLQQLQEFANAKGIALRPHYKSHKSTTIAHLQIAAGAKGICCAKLGEAEDLVAAGIEDVLIANQVTVPAKIARVAALAGACTLTVCVDHLQNIADLSASASVQGTIIRCLVEYDIGMNRCGVHTHQEVSNLAKQIMKSPNLVFEGIQAYAGNIAHCEDYETRKQESVRIEADLHMLKSYLESQGIVVKEISGVSTGTALFRPQDSIYTELQAGSYIFMDTAYRELELPFRNALFVLTTVISESNGGIITDAGRKSVSTDQRPPEFAEYPGVEIDFSEEHSAILPVVNNHKIGDRLRIIPSHCCTTVNLHDYYTLVRDGKVIDRIPVTSRGKSW